MSDHDDSVLDILGEGMTDGQRLMLRDLWMLCSDILDECDAGLAVDMEARAAAFVRRWQP